MDKKSFIMLLVAKEADIGIGLREIMIKVGLTENIAVM